jgi:hypothetical protein
MILAFVLIAFIASFACFGPRQDMSKHADRKKAALMSKYLGRNRLRLATAGTFE